jgi:hypothetical protein
MRLDEWLRFCREEQHEADEEASIALFKKSAAASFTIEGEQELLRTLCTARPLASESRGRIAGLAVQAAQKLLRRTHGEPAADDDTSKLGLSLLQFQQLLLSEDNRAVCPKAIAAGKKLSEADDFTQPLSHYWVSCSHNSYLDGDQIASNSSADMYKRLLLQGCRALEIVRRCRSTLHALSLSTRNTKVSRSISAQDCWDGEDGEPEVTHGHTLCSKVKFKDVITAFSQYAFVASELPVQISLEMHCSPTQQQKIARMFRGHLHDMLLPAESTEFSSKQLEQVSPCQLLRRVLIKGKIVPLVTEDSLKHNSKGTLARRLSSLVFAPKRNGSGTPEAPAKTPSSDETGKNGNKYGSVCEEKSQRRTCGASVVDVLDADEEDLEESLMQYKLSLRESSQTRRRHRDRNNTFDLGGILSQPGSLKDLRQLRMGRATSKELAQFRDDFRLKAAQAAAMSKKKGKRAKQKKKVR